MGLTDALESMCKPLLLFIIFEAALITYNLTQGKVNSAIVNGILTVIGASLIYLLCSFGFEIAAWMLLAIVPFFFVALIAFLIITQLISTDALYWNGPKSGIREAVTNRYIRKMLGLPEEAATPEPAYDYVENPTIDEIYNRYNEGSEYSDE
jgi:hypothetical protein